MVKNNSKGIALVEMILVIALFAVASTIFFYMFRFGTESYNTYNRYLEQQYKVMNVTQHLRKDISEAQFYNVSTDGRTLTLIYPIETSDGDLEIDIAAPSEEDKESIVHRWQFDTTNNKLLFSECKVEDISSSAYETFLEGIDATNCTFELIESKESIILKIKPKSTNENVHKNRNVEEIATEFSVKYKIKI